MNTDQEIKDSVKTKMDDFIKNKSQEIKISFSRDQLEFVNANLADWIDSVFLAKKMKENHRYIILNKKIVPVDSENTGEIQTNSHLAKGLHQFLEIKHNLDITPLNLTSNYKSNVSNIYTSLQREKILPGGKIAK